MNRILRAILGVIFIGIIMFSGISICQNLGGASRLDITEQKLYTLSDGTRAILGKLNQPIKVKLFYAKTAAMKAPDQIKFYIDYYYFVRALLQEYERSAQGMLDLAVIDPRPFSDEEEEALRYRLEAFPISEEERFIFGLIVQTQFGAVKSIPFFTPDRQNFVEYDISYLIDQAVTREKHKIGILSSLPVMGDDVTGYMAQMMQMQGQRPKPAWHIVSQLRQKYEVSKVESEITEVPSDIDILLVIHPKDLPEKTLWAIDQFVLKGGRTIVMVDPYALVDSPTPQQRMMGQMAKTSSDLNQLLRNWGLEMPPEKFAGDLNLAMPGSLRRSQRPQTIIGFLELQPGCFNKDEVITSELNQVQLLFSGVLREVEMEQPETTVSEPKEEQKPSADQGAQIELTPLLMTTAQGNTWTANQFELSMGDPGDLVNNFVAGNKPVNMAYLATGRFKTAFPGGIEIEDEESESSDEENDEEKEEVKTKVLTGLTECKDCAVAVFADVDFIADFAAFRSFGPFVSVVGDNAALLLNTIETLSGTGDLISIRSRGNVKRPFTVVEKIEAQAEQATRDKVAQLQAKISGFAQELNQLKASSQQQEQGALQSSVLQKIRQVQQAQRSTQKELLEVNRDRFRGIEQLGVKLKIINMLLAPVIILIIAVVLGIRRSVRRRHYISHASDA